MQYEGGRVRGGEVEEGHVGELGRRGGGVWGGGGALFYHL